MVKMRYGTPGAGGQGARVSLLWDNPNVTSTFGAQTVTLSNGIKGFDLILVSYYFSTSYPYMRTQLFIAGDVMSESCELTVASNNGATGKRRFTAPTDSTVDFTAATYSGSTSNGSVIPVAIYGIKL